MATYFYGEGLGKGKIGFRQYEGDPSFDELCALWPELKTFFSREYPDYKSAETALATIDQKMKIFQRDPRWYRFVVSSFQMIDLPEVTKSQLAVGLYTNMEIADLLKERPQDLLSILVNVSKMGSPAEKRAAISLTIDQMIDQLSKKMNRRNL